MAKEQLKYSLFVEKYRPNSIDNVLLTKANKQFFRKMVEEKEVPNLLFMSSSPGTGKTTTAKALVHDIGSDYIYINTSSESGIDTLRGRIAKFATSYSLFGNDGELGGDNRASKKICILDEFDGSTPALQAALRAFMEEFQDSCRFILTCNYATKIIEPLKSRCQIVDFNITDAKSQAELKPNIVKRLIGILKQESIEFKKETITKICDTFYPDIRKMVNILQQYSKKNGIIDSGIFDMEKVDAEFYDLILHRQLTKARKYVLDRNYNSDEMYRNLFDDFVPMLDKSIQPQAILVISEYMYRSAFSIDKEITLTACLIELMALLPKE